MSTNSALSASKPTEPPISTQAPIQSMTRTGRVRCGSTPRCNRFSARVASALLLSVALLPPADSRGRRESHARVNTARCDARECRDWCTVSLCRRTEDLALPSSVGAGSSSKNLRQSSVFSASSSPFFSGSSSSEESPLVDFDAFWAFGGFAPSSATHHSFSSDLSVGKVVRRSRMDSRLTATLGFSLSFSSVLNSHQSNA